jgi:hypothetical protein
MSHAHRHALHVSRRGFAVATAATVAWAARR